MINLIINRQGRQGRQAASSWRTGASWRFIIKFNLAPMTHRLAPTNIISCPAFNLRQQKREAEPPCWQRG
ncbi:MAG: hypothetical protein KME26_13545 [Oscillatoria princeps RMCB-10]|nr:hypothetical protein [Oscillatoria princeps RMCB-10]